VAPVADDCSARSEVSWRGWHEYALVAWSDRFRTWRGDLQIKAAAGQDVSVELLEGAMLVRETAARAEQIGSGRGDAEWLLAQADSLCEATRDIGPALSEDLATLMDKYADRTRATTSPARRVWVDRERARFGGWY